MSVEFVGLTPKGRTTARKTRPQAPAPPIQRTQRKLAAGQAGCHREQFCRCHSCLQFSFQNFSLRSCQLLFTLSCDECETPNMSKFHPVNSLSHRANCSIEQRWSEHSRSNANIARAVSNEQNIRCCSSWPEMFR
eukprot:s605_g24.t1